jgi:hypothetical protein
MGKQQEREHTKDSTKAGGPVAHYRCENNISNWSTKKTAIQKEEL